MNITKTLLLMLFSSSSCIVGSLLIFFNLFCNSLSLLCLCVCYVFVQLCTLTNRLEFTIVLAAAEAAKAAKNACLAKHSKVLRENRSKSHFKRARR